MKLFAKLAVTGATLGSLLLAGCGGGGGSPLGEAPSGSPSAGGGGAGVIVGSANFTENQILAELYAQAMQAKGVSVTKKLNISSREAYIKALRDGSISVIPEYTGNLLQFLDSSSTATTEAELEKALPTAVGSDLKIGTVSKAADQDVYVVTKAYSEANGITSLDDLKKIASNATLGGPSELEKRPYGPPGLAKIYGATFKSFKPYDSPAVKVKDLNDNKIQVATFFTTESAIGDNGYVSLSDPQSMILPQQVVPLMRADVASNTTATSAIDAVQAALTTEELTALNKKVDVDQQDADQVAGEWLKAKGLV